MIFFCLKCYEELSSTRKTTLSNTLEILKGSWDTYRQTDRITVHFQPFPWCRKNSQIEKLFYWKFRQNIFNIVKGMKKNPRSVCCETSCIFNWISNNKILISFKNIACLNMYYHTFTVLNIRSDRSFIVIRTAEIQFNIVSVIFWS